MEKYVWNDEKVIELLEDFVFVKIDVELNNDLVYLYKVYGIPNILVLDGNGKIFKRVDDSMSTNEVKSLLQSFQITTEYLSIELINYFATINYNTALRVYQKYLDFYLLVDKSIQYNVMEVGNDYLEDAQNMLSRKDENYLEKKQKLDLFAIYVYAYQNKYKQLEYKLSKIKETDIMEGNQNLYYFLIYITAKGLQKDNFPDIESKVSQLDGFDYLKQKADFILSNSR